MSYVNDYTKCYYCEKSHIEHNEKIKKIMIIIMYVSYL